MLISVVKDTTGEYLTALYILAGVMLVSIALPLVIRPPRAERAGEGTAGGEAQPAASR